MWRVVENRLTSLSPAGNARSISVENDCGQMCTNARDGAVARARSARGFQLENRLISRAFRAKNHDRDARRRVTSLFGRDDHKRVEKATPVHTAMWTGC